MIDRQAIVVAALGSPYLGLYLSPTLGDHWFEMYTTCRVSVDGQYRLVSVRSSGHSHEFSN